MFWNLQYYIQYTSIIYETFLYVKHFEIYSVIPEEIPANKKSRLL